MRVPHHILSVGVFIVRDDAATSATFLILKDALEMVLIVWTKNAQIKCYYPYDVSYKANSFEALEMCYY